MNENLLREKSVIDGYYMLSSERFSNKYYNLKDLYCRDHTLVLDYFVERINDMEFDCICTIELGGALIGAGLSERLNKPLCVLRKDAPLLGTPSGKCLVIDDVSTTGNSLNRVKSWVRSCNAEVHQIIVGIDRREKGAGMA